MVTNYRFRMEFKQQANSKLYIIPKAKHMATYERAELVNLEISNFII